MISYSNVEFIYEPYPVCYLQSFIDPAIYEEMLRTWPETELFKFMPSLGSKYSLSEMNNIENYLQYVKKTPVWSDFHAFIKSDDFIMGTLEFLRSKNVDLNLRKPKIVSKKPGLYPSLSSKIRRATELSARFEFSMMGPDGGNILPHTDASNKLITLVVSILEPGEWDSAWGGGTEICMPKDKTRIFNITNKYMTFDETDVLRRFPFVPNQCVLFIKTYNSWHQVSPMTGGKDAPMRRTLTINIERRE